ncbi:MAG: MBL fold metallo-hydrolase [Planctomycetota bacterium]|jgi:glyoxylase-like metal-dependent hydrolase (beta-lactamase superfamily II)
MPEPTCDVISIGTLASNPLWNEREPVRTGHATTTLVRADDRLILIDPGLPAQALGARLAERANIAPDQITDVFLTSFQPETFRAIELFASASWWAHEPEREGVGVPLLQTIASAHEDNNQELLARLQHDAAILERCKPAPDSLAPKVDLFPVPGLSPGSCAILLPLARTTILIAGDTIATGQHLREGKVLPHCHDIEQAQESFRDAIEIADLIIPGRDNIALNPTRAGF